MRICVFLGSNRGVRPEYADAAIYFGQCLARDNIGLVYGGASVGLMGEVARATVEAGGEVIGVIPHRIAQLEIAADFIPDLRYVDTLEERENLMFELSDGFVAIPGGVGTLEELFTALTWNILKYHNKPIGLLNTCKYYDKLMELLNFQSNEGFIPTNWIDSLIVEEDVDALIHSVCVASTSYQHVGVFPH